MIQRNISGSILKAQDTIPVICITGPRQSGKTTLVKSLFPDYKYYNLEFPEHRQYAQNDALELLKDIAQGIIIDEIQRVPELLSSIQYMVDKTRLNGKIVIIGSQNLLLMQSVSQTLAGRVALFTLLPFSIYELQGTDFEKNDIASYIVKSMYPRIYDQKPDFNIWLQDYITTYVERDVRLITSIKDLSLFTNFLKLCAGHTGQIVNFTTLSNNLGIDIKTVKAWLSILETSYIVFLLQPYYNNFNKRIIKAPKLYFYDTGLACSLLGVKSADDYKMHYLRGGLFESFIISEFYKYIFNQKLNSGVYFYRDSNGNEIDTILELNGKLIAVEIKSGQMIIPDFFKGLKTWGKLSESNHDYRFVIYGGEEMQNRSDAKVLGWKNLTEVFNIE